MRKKVKGVLISSIPLLMSMSSGSLYSPAFGLSIGKDYAEKMVASEQISTTVMSTRSDKMADIVLNFDIFLTNQDGLSTFDRPYYDVYYRINEKIYENVAYANGAFNWFTEHGNVVLEDCSVRCVFPKWSEHNSYNGIFAPDLANRGYLNVMNPALNQDYYSPIQRSDASSFSYAGRFCTSIMPYGDDGEVSRNNLIPIDQPKTKFDAVTRYFNNDTETAYCANFSHESMPQNGETLVYYGHFGFTPLMETDSVSVKISFDSTVSIARDNKWGSCIMTGQNEKTITLPNWHH